MTQLDRLVTLTLSKRSKYRHAKINQYYYLANDAPDRWSYFDVGDR
jgi:hypothetical protein